MYLLVNCVYNFSGISSHIKNHILVALFRIFRFNQIVFLALVIIHYPFRKNEHLFLRRDLKYYDEFPL